MKQSKHINSGFTLVETLISIFILTTAITAFMGLVANNWYIARYTNNEITANYLTQEVFDFIRNDRDTTMFLGNIPASPSTSRTTFYGRYGVDGTWITGTKSVCYTTDGCQFDATNFATTLSACPSGGCTQTLYYDPSPTTGGFYTYTSNARTIPTSFVRQINMTTNANNFQKDELNITVKLTWKNGTQLKSRSSYYTLMDWQK